MRHTDEKVVFTIALLQVSTTTGASSIAPASTTSNDFNDFNDFNDSNDFNDFNDIVRDERSNWARRRTGFNEHRQRRFWELLLLQELQGFKN